MVHKAAKSLENNEKESTVDSAMAKRYATDVCFEICNEALQIHGGYGYLSDFGFEKMVRDCRVHQILEGTNEIMRLIISRKILGKTKMDDIKIQKNATILITLTREKVLNALNLKW